MVPDSRINSCVSWLFLTYENKHQLILRIRFPGSGKETSYVNAQRCQAWMHNNYYTYLNSDLLKVPRKYVLHGLVPSSNWAPLWPYPMSMPRPAGICCLLQLFKFHTQCLLLSGWLLTNIQVNIITTLHDIGHTCIYITWVLLFISSFYTSSIFLGRLAALHSFRLLHNLSSSK